MSSNQHSTLGIDLSPKFSSNPPDEFFECKERFGVSWENTVITVGDTIYSKYLPIAPDLLCHEMVHVRQQTEMGKDKWWGNYFMDPEFRFKQELEAYKAQYKWTLSNVNDREGRSKLLQHYARSLSSERYGNLLSWNEALSVIRTDA